MRLQWSSTVEHSDEPGQASEPAVQASDFIDAVELATAVDFEEFKHFLDHVPIAIIVLKFLRGEQRIVYANKAFEVLTAWELLGEIKGRNWSILNSFRNEDDSQVTLGHALLSDEEAIGTFKLEDPKPALVEVHVGIIQDDAGAEKYRIAALVDLTERQRAQREEFARQIRDKDLLLRELQHRVKNNLQLITALIRLEARSQQNGDRANLDRLAGRIESLQFLYNALSVTPAGQDIDLGQYLSQIAAGVMRTHAIEGIRLDVKVEPAPVSINVAMPVGLAVNELLTNAFKYAFVGRDRGVITLACLREEPDRYHVIVADDGIGLPPGISWPAQAKLGALILQSLRENAETELNVESVPGAGTRIAINFVPWIKAQSSVVLREAIPAHS
jgi:PAS domain S-box-containing protein